MVGKAGLRGDLMFPLRKSDKQCPPKSPIHPYYCKTNCVNQNGWFELYGALRILKHFLLLISTPDTGWHVHICPQNRSPKRQKKRRYDYNLKRHEYPTLDYLQGS